MRLKFSRLNLYNSWNILKLHQTPWHLLRKKKQETRGPHRSPEVHKAMTKTEYIAKSKRCVLSCFHLFKHRIFVELWIPSKYNYLARRMIFLINIGYVYSFTYKDTINTIWLNLACWSSFAKFCSYFTF